MLISRPAEANSSAASYMEKFMSDTLPAVRKLLDMDVAFVAEFQNGRRYFRSVDSRPDFHPIEVGDSAPLEESYCQRVVDGRLPNLMPDACQNVEALKLAVTKSLPVGGHISVPIRFKNGHVYGTFCCFSRKPSLDLVSKDVEVMALFADFMANVLEEKDAQTQAHRAVEDRIRAAIEVEKFALALQPIVDVTTHQTIGFEALARFESDPYRPPNEWFSDAADVGMQDVLETAMHKKALSYLASIPSDAYLSLNVSAETVLKASLSEQFSGYPLNRIMLEITEHESIDDYEKIAEMLAPLRGQGMRLAVDDAGAGYASLRHILQLKPDVIKLDRSLIQNINSDFSQQTLASSLINFANQVGIQVIAEGVETHEELNVLRKMGINKAQGYLLGHPKTLGDSSPVMSHGDASEVEVTALART